MLPTKDIHNMAVNYDKFCSYAGITFIRDNWCDQYTGITGITHYDNPVVKGDVRWTDTLYGEMATVYCANVPDYDNSLHHKLLNKTFTIPDRYLVKGYITKGGFERWINDRLLEITP